jgi:hypothetical protein
VGSSLAASAAAFGGLTVVLGVSFGAAGAGLCGYTIVFSCLCVGCLVWSASGAGLCACKIFFIFSFIFFFFLCCVCRLELRGGALRNICEYSMFWYTNRYMTNMLVH